MQPILHGCPFKTWAANNDLTETPDKADAAIVMANVVAINWITGEQAPRLFGQFNTGVFYVHDWLVRDCGLPKLPPRWTYVVGDGPHEKYHWMPTGYSPDAFNPCSAKTIGVLFAGRIKRCKMRRRVLNDLRASKLSGVFMDTIGRKNSYEMYADRMSKAKIVVNVSRTKDGSMTQQFKSRVIEAGLAGACLLESRNDLTGRLFEEGEDFVFWDEPKDLIQKCRHLLGDDLLRERKAANLRKRVMANYTADIFWNKLGHIARQE